MSSTCQVKLHLKYPLLQGIFEIVSSKAPGGPLKNNIKRPIYKHPRWNWIIIKCCCFNNIRPNVCLPNILNEIHHCGYGEDFWQTLCTSPVTMATTEWFTCLHTGSVNKKQSSPTYKVLNSKFLIRKTSTRRKKH